MSESIISATEIDTSPTVTGSSVRFSSSSDFESSPSSSGRQTLLTSLLSPSTVAPSQSSAVTEAISTLLPATTSPPPLVSSSSDAASTASPTVSVIHPVQNTTHASESGLSKAKIVAIAVSAGAGALLIAALIFLLVWRKRRANSKRHNKAPSRNVDAETMEKFAPPPEYRQLGYENNSPGTESKFSLPFVRTSFGESRRGSRFSADFAQYKDSPPSPFVNDEVEANHAPLTHAISLADATPYIHYMDEIQLEPVPGPLPNPHPEPKPAAQQLPPLVIPSSYAAPTRRTTKGKRVSRRGSNHTYRAVDTGDQSDVDSESMYSQASAHSMGFPVDNNPRDSVSSARQSPLSPPPAIREKRESNASESTIRPGDTTRGSAFTDMTGAEGESQRTDAENAMAWLVREENDVSGGPSEHDTEMTGEMTRENSAFIAQLLKSRGKSQQPPARSDSVVSHIERKGSIRPADRGVRPLRVSRKTHEPGSAARERD